MKVNCSRFYEPVKLLNVLAAGELLSPLAKINNIVSLAASSTQSTLERENCWEIKVLTIFPSNKLPFHGIFHLPQPHVVLLLYCLWGLVGQFPSNPVCPQCFPQLTAVIPHSILFGTESFPCSWFRCQKAVHAEAWFHGYQQPFGTSVWWLLFMREIKQWSVGKRAYHGGQCGWVGFCPHLISVHMHNVQPRWLESCCVTFPSSSLPAAPLSELTPPHSC